MVETVDSIVVGAGVVGLAVARRLALDGREVLIVEAAERIGSETSARNSEVVHAGIYYPTGSLKARLCVAGRKMLYAFCADRGVDARRTGKLIVAVEDAEVPGLQALASRAAMNGVDDVEMLCRADVRRLEPDLSCVAALLSPSSGIVDCHALMLALLGEGEAAGAVLALRTRVVAAEPCAAGLRVMLNDEGGETFEVDCGLFVNSAGHGAHALAAGITGYPEALLPPRFLAKGSYFSVSGRSPFRHLVYPMPVAGALGIHLTLDLANQVKLGPDIEWVDTADYVVDPSRETAFRNAVGRYWPGVADRTLYPGYSGLRPKIHGPDAVFADFVVQGPREHGVSGLVNLFGIESPGLTSSLAIADYIAEQARDHRGSAT